MQKRILQLRCSEALLGAESVVLELAAQSPALGYESIVGVPHEPAAAPPELYTRARDAGLPATLFPCRGRFDPALPGVLRRFVRDQGIDLVHCHGYKEDFYALLGRLGVPLVATNHLWKRSTRALTFYAWLDGRLLRHFDHVVAVSEPIRQEVAAAGVAPARLSRIANGIDLTRFSAGHPDRVAAGKRQLGLNPGCISLGMISSLTAAKGHRYALEALARVVERQPQTQLLIVGEGPDAPELQRQSEALGLTQHVVFAGRRGDVPRVLDAIDIFLLPSLKEGLPMAMLEAMAASKPVIASDVGDVATAVRDGSTGLLVPPADSAGLAAALQRLLTDEEERRRLGGNARECVEAEFSAAAMARAYCDLYERQLALGPTVAPQVEQHRT